jgi:nematocidal protein AidA
MEMLVIERQHEEWQYRQMKEHHHMSTINIVMVFDTQSIMSAYPSPSSSSSNPTPVAHNDIYMITQPGFVTSTSPTTMATADLNITALTGDTIRWYATALSGDLPTYVIPYAIAGFSTTTIMAAPTPLETQPTVPVPTLPFPTSGNPAYTSVVETNYFLQSTVANSGTEQYSVSFMVVQQQQNGTLATVGYYNWDPTVTVNA